MITKIKKMLAQIFLTHIGRLFFLAGPLLIIGGIMNSNGTIGKYIDYKNDGVVWDWLIYIACGIMIVEFFWMMYYATKNTINDIKIWWQHRKKK